MSTTRMRGAFLIFIFCSAASSSRADPPSEITKIETPKSELQAIRLPGETKNPSPEVWELLQLGLPPGAGNDVGSFGKPEMWVRNVSKPTLLPLLPKVARSAGSAMIVVPGGGLMGLAIDREGYSVATWLNHRGIAAFVLKYRLIPMPSDPYKSLSEFNRRVDASRIRLQETHSKLSAALSDEQRHAFSAATDDALEAIRYVRAHAANWHLKPDRIGIVGFSAGGMIALSAALTSDSMSRPDLVASIYGALAVESPIVASVPPAFIAVANDDGAAEFSTAIYGAWHSAKAPAELHVFESGGHGFGTLNQDKSSDSWLVLFDHWLASHGYEALAVSGHR